MSVQQVADLDQGVRIDHQKLVEAGLHPPLRIVVEEGEVRIVSAEGSAAEQPAADAWDAFRTLGADAPQGRLPNAAAEHDRYLYGAGERS